MGGPKRILPADGRMDPGVMQVALLNQINENLIDLFDLQLKQRQEGIVEPYKFNITTTVKVLRAIKPWFSVLIWNDGPATLNVITSPSKNSIPHQMIRGESYVVQFTEALISDVQLWCDSGTTSVRLDGVR